MRVGSGEPWERKIGRRSMRSRHWRSVGALFVLSLVLLLALSGAALAASTLSSDQPSTGSDRLFSIGDPVPGPTSADVLLVQDYYPWNTWANQQALQQVGLTYLQITSAQLAKTDLSHFRAIMIPSVQSSSYYENVADNMEKISAFVSRGGLLIAHACDQSDSHWSGILPGGIGHVHFFSDYLHITVDKNADCAARGLTDDYFDHWNSSSHDYFTDLPFGCRTYVRTAADGYPVCISYKWGSGLVLATGQTIEWGYTVMSRPQLLLNELDYAKRHLPPASRTLVSARRF
jgi:hypothetical protein